MHVLRKNKEENIARQAVPVIQVELTKCQSMALEGEGPGRRDRKEGKVHV